jgi:hypothetical protein
MPGRSPCSLAAAALLSLSVLGLFAELHMRVKNGHRSRMEVTLIRSDREALEETLPDARSQEQKQQHTRHLEWLLKQDDELAGRFKCFLVLPEIRTVPHWMTRLWR